MLISQRSSQQNSITFCGHLNFLLRFNVLAQKRVFLILYKNTKSKLLSIYFSLTSIKSYFSILYLLVLMISSSSLAIISHNILVFVHIGISKGHIPLVFQKLMVKMDLITISRWLRNFGVTLGSYSHKLFWDRTVCNFLYLLQKYSIRSFDFGIFFLLLKKLFLIINLNILMIVVLSENIFPKVFHPQFFLVPFSPITQFFLILLTDPRAMVVMK